MLTSDPVGQSSHPTSPFTPEDVLLFLIYPLLTPTFIPIRTAEITSEIIVIIILIIVPVQAGKLLEQEDLWCDVIWQRTHDPEGTTKKVKVEVTSEGLKPGGGGGWGFSGLKTALVAETLHLLTSDEPRSVECLEHCRGIPSLEGYLLQNIADSFLNENFEL